MVFPYPPRPGQPEIVESISASLADGRCHLLEAATGSGKTVCALSALVPLALAEARRIVYCVRTNSQQAQVITELRALREADVAVRAVALQGRGALCPQATHDPELARSNPTERAKLCARLKRLARNGDGGCDFYARLNTGGPALMERWSDELFTAEELAAEARAAGVCPYELLKLLLPRAHVVVVPYVFLFQPFIRGQLLDWLGAGLEELLVVIDEAHNLPDWARDEATYTLGVETLRRAMVEAARFEVALPDGRAPKPFLEAVEAAIEALADIYIAPREREGRMPSHVTGGTDGLPTLETELMELARLTLNDIGRIGFDLAHLGEVVRQQRLEKGLRPRSYLGAVGEFLTHWLDTAEEHTVRLVHSDPLQLESFCLDPRVLTSFLERTAGVLAMSGTLAPLGHYRELIGLPDDTTTEVHGSPFPAANRLTLYLSGVTTAHATLSRDPGAWHALMARLGELLAGFAGNAALFFPSYDLLERGLSELRLAKPVYREARGMPQEELMATVAGFKGDRAAVLAGVMGGRLAEGIDYPDATLELVVIVGIPYPYPSARQQALKHYCDLAFQGRGWQFAVELPALRRLRQAAGRLIRSATDRGVVVIADHRAARFRPALEGLREARDVVGEVRDFFATPPRVETPTKSPSESP